MKERTLLNFSVFFNEFFSTKEAVSAESSHQCMIQNMDALYPELRDAINKTLINL